MRTRRMSAPLGLIIDDLDVRSINNATWSELDELFCKHHVLVFPDQQLSPADHQEFA
jgi:alpha-ketoglutarate-dependent taurine dioxygenase